MELAKSISVIIPNYNGRHLLQEYLPCNLEVMAATGADYEIIIVDDASKDDSVEFIRTTYPNVKLIVNAEEKGFSYAYNRGIELARCELILLLSADVKLTPGYFDHQWKYFLRWETFGVMGRIINMEGERIQDAARMPELIGFKLKTDFFYYSNDEKDRLYTLYLSGANALIRAEKLKEIGGFYELLTPFDGEDLEISIRAWRIRWKCYYEHKAVCRRQVSAGTDNHETAKWVKNVYLRNLFYVHAIHLNGFALWAWYCQVTLTIQLPNLLIGQTRIWKSYRELFAHRAVIRRYKKEINVLMEKTGSHSTIFSVVKKIKNSAKNKNYVHFKT